MTTEQITLTEEQKKVRSSLVRALWTVDSRSMEFDDVAAKKAAFAEERPSYVQKANRLIRQLNNSGVSLSASSN